MKRGSTLFLKITILVLGLMVLLWMIIFPQKEGRAAELDLFNIYKDPFIIYIYIASIPFFVALYQAFKLLGYIEKDKVFSPISINTLRNIKYCAVSIIGFSLVAAIYIWIMARSTHEDSAGFIALEMIVIFTSVVIATAAGVFQSLLQNAVDIKSENDLTV